MRKKRYTQKKTHPKMKKDMLQTRRRKPARVVFAREQ
jgi:hypothetical protein